MEEKTSMEDLKDLITKNLSEITDAAKQGELNRVKLLKEFDIMNNNSRNEINIIIARNLIEIKYLLIDILRSKKFGL